MTNQEIIGIEKARRGIEGECHTYHAWLKLGFKVRKGEHATFKTKIWVFKKETVEVADGVFEVQEGFVLKNAAFFTENQVEAA